MQGIFTLYDFVGQPVSHWAVKEIEVPKPQIEKNVGHHIVVVDRSGSMWGEMDDTKAMIEKVFTVEEFHDANLLLSLISYSSSGDTTVHFARIPVQEVNKPKSPYVDQLRAIRATYLTCASDALNEAAKLVEDETTAISLHTDGWFNDKSPAAEKREIEKILAQLAKKPNVMINTIAYRQSSDFNYLSQIANRMSGACVLAKDVKQVFTALHDTTALLAGRVTPAIPLGIDGADWQIATNFSRRKVNGAATDIVIRGMDESDALKVYRFSKLSKSTFERSNLPLVDRQGEAGRKVLAAFARTQLAEGKVNAAKYALVTMRDSALLKKHYLALSSSQLAALAEDLDSVLYGTEALGEQQTSYGLETTGTPLIELFSTLNQAEGQYSLHAPSFEASYHRRGLRKLEGSWKDGQFIPNEIRLVDASTYEEDPQLEVAGWEVNTSEATVNVTTSRAGVLEQHGKKIVRIAGQKVDLKLHKSYTVVADGQPNVDAIPLVISSKSLYETLVEKNFLPAEPYNHQSVYKINISTCPVVPLTTECTLPSKAELLAYAEALVEKKIIQAFMPDSVKAKFDWTPEQIAELRSFGLTPNLVYSAPSTTPYSDREAAIQNGLIDNFTRYTISVGCSLASDLRSALWSANEYLARRFSVTVVGSTDVDKSGFEKKPKFVSLWDNEAKVTAKELSSRTKLTELDDFVMPVFEKFIQVQELSKFNSERTTVDDRSPNLKNRLSALTEIIGSFEERLAQIALTVGSTGLIPESWDAKLWTAEQLQASYPNMDIPKGHTESTFFEVDGVLLGVHPVVAWYSTPAGIAEADKLQPPV